MHVNMSKIEYSWVGIMLLRVSLMIWRRYLFGYTVQIYSK